MAHVGETIEHPLAGERFTFLETAATALRLETFFETWFGLAGDGKVNAHEQMPSFSQLVVVMHDYRAEMGAPGLAGVAREGWDRSYHHELAHEE
jgi:hypothetical protein